MTTPEPALEPDKPRLLSIEHLDRSTLAGRTQRFAGVRVRIGRRPDNDVVFDPQADRAVSSYHCELLREGDQVTLRDLGAQNGTYIGETQITGDHPLSLPVDIRLGQHGPLLRLALVADEPVAAAPSAQRSGIGEATLERAISTATGHERTRSRRALKVLLAALAVVAIGAGVIIWRHGERMDREAADRTAAQRQMHDELTATREAAAAAQNAWSELAKHIRGSVFLCVAEDPAKGVSGIGTAFVIGEHGLLATNAHVAQMLREMPVRAVVQNGTGRAFMVKRIAIHSAYKGPMSPDVALIDIDTEGQTLVALQLAALTDLKNLDVGTELGTMGYPGELGESYFAQRSGAQQQLFSGAVATFKTGRIGRLMTYDLDAGGFMTRKIIQHSASLTGGTSGSPMLSIDGKVVGLNNAGLDQSVMVANEGAAAAPMRMANPAQIGHAIRVDELSSLLNKPVWVELPANP